MPIVPSSAGWRPTSETLASLTSRVARLLSAASEDTQIQQEAQDAIRDAVREWNRFRAWDYLRIEGTFSAEADGTVIVPGHFRTPYSCKVGGRTLEYVTDRYLHRLAPDEAQHPELIVAYTDFHVGQNSKLEFYFGGLGAGETAEVKYHRAATLPSGPEDALDFPEDFVDALYFIAAKNFLLGRTGQEKRWEMFKLEAREHLVRARMADQRRPDAQPRLIPPGEHQVVRFGPDNPLFLESL